MSTYGSTDHYIAFQTLLSGCSAGGLAAILHCDEFRQLVPNNTQVKCLADAGMFLDAYDIFRACYLFN